MAGMARVRLDPRALSRVRGGWSQKAFARRRSAAALFRGGIAGQIAENAADDVFFCGAGISCCLLPRRSRSAAFSCEGGNIILSAAGSMLVFFYARAPGQIMARSAYFVLSGRKPRHFWRDIREMYLPTVFFGSKRTKYAYFAKMGCPGVHFSEIMPESCSLAALEYIWRRFRHVSAFRPGIAHWGKPCLTLSDMFPRSAQGLPVVWGPGIALA